MIKNLNDELPIVRDSLYDKAALIQFERKMADYWESGKVRGPIHLSGGNCWCHNSYSNRCRNCK